MVFFVDVLKMFDVGDEIAEVMAFSHLGKSEKVDNKKVTDSSPCSTSSSIAPRRYGSLVKELFSAIDWLLCLLTKCPKAHLDSDYLR